MSIYRYRLNMDRIDVTRFCDPGPRYLFAPYVPVLDTNAALLRFWAQRRFGWHSRGAKRCANAATAQSDGA